MEAQTRQRLIGTILLLLLAAILAPLLLRGPEEVRVALDLDIPQPPPVAPVEPRPVVAESELEQTRAQIDKDRRAAREHVEESATENGESGSPALSGWSVQVASFTQRDNAKSLEKRLRDAGYNAYWREQRQEDAESLFRVFAGPELERADARALKRRLVAEQGIGDDGLVVPYEP